MIDYVILPAHRLIITWSRGIISVAECIERVRAIIADPEHSLDYDVISDITELETDFSMQEVGEIIRFLKTLPRAENPAKNAIIAPTNRNFATSRMYEQRSEGLTPLATSVFRDWTSAIQWLGKDPAHLQGHLKAG